MKIIHWIAWVLVIVGSLNWGLVGFFGFNLVTTLLGETAIANVVYDLVGLAAVWMIIEAFKKQA
ncbi:MAG: DUF378 domain-containing protein [bacterium]